ncbi:MAG: ABC transporter ATP-binding protein [Granulosicoccus sp.]
MPSDADILLTASNLSRVLSDRAAVHDINLTLRRGDVLGLLGLNGAGKSTTLQLLCGALAADTGTVIVNGHDLHDEPLAARAQIGYLPDLPPLYPDMRVNSYLQLCARIRRLHRSAVATRVEAVIEQCQLGDVRRQRIAELSKGYRQRVGLAQALVHEPAVILLDEPSNGLDPQQMQEMRELIRTLGEQQSVIFSTHLLAEAQTVCTRIAVMHEGRLVADRAADGSDLGTLFAQIVNTGKTDDTDLASRQSRVDANNRDAHL